MERRVRESHDAEIEQLHAPQLAVGKKQVARLDVAMDEPRACALPSVSATRVAAARLVDGEPGACQSLREVFASSHSIAR